MHKETVIDCTCACMSCTYTYTAHSRKVTHTRAIQDRCVAPLVLFYQETAVTVL